MVPEGVRIAFRKTGSLQFISHLDLCRTMKNTFIRAGIPIWYSEGFNPHPKMVFSLPLSIGTESICELMDIKITEKMGAKEIKDRLNAALTDELRITRVYRPGRKFSEIAWAMYDIVFGAEVTGAETYFQSPCLVMRRTKSGEVETDITPMIRFARTEGKKMTVMLSATQEAYLNPEYPAQVIADALSIEDHRIIRTGIFLSDGVTRFE